MDDELLFPADDLNQWARGSLPLDVMGARMAILRRRCEAFSDKIERLRTSDPELYRRLNSPM